MPTIEYVFVNPGWVKPPKAGKRAYKAIKGIVAPGGAAVADVTGAIAAVKGAVMGAMTIAHAAVFPGGVPGKTEKAIRKVVEYAEDISALHDGANLRKAVAELGVWRATAAKAGLLKKTKGGFVADTKNPVIAAKQTAKDSHNTCIASVAGAAVGGPHGAWAGAIAGFDANNPNHNLFHLRFDPAAKAVWTPQPIFDTEGELPFSWADYNAARTDMLNMSDTAAVAGPLKAKYIKYLDSIADVCTDQGAPHIGENTITGNALVRARTAAGFPNRLDHSERTNLGYSMGMLMCVLVARLSGYTFPMHITILDRLIPPAPAQGSQYHALPRDKPDIITLTNPGGLGTTIHILEAKGSLATNSNRTLVAVVNQFLNSAMDQCLKYESFIVPPPAVTFPAAMPGWSIVPLFLGGAGAIIKPTSRVATLAELNMATNRWKVWLTDPSEETEPAPPEFSDGSLRMYYSQFISYFMDDSGSLAVKLNGNGGVDLNPLHEMVLNKSVYAKYVNVKSTVMDFLIVQIPEVNVEIGLSANVIALLMREPSTGYTPAGSLSIGIVSVLKETPFQGDGSKLRTVYGNGTETITDSYNMNISREGVFSANIRNTEPLLPPRQGTKRPRGG